MSRLKLYLIVNHLPVQPAWFEAATHWLQAHYDLQVTVLNNGWPKNLIQQAPAFQHADWTLEHLPLAYSSGQLLQMVARRRHKADYILWLEDRVLWDYERLPLWLEVLGNWTAVHPAFTPPPGLELDFRLRQEPSLVRERLPRNHFSLSLLETLPPCLCFPVEQLPIVLEWTEPTGQMPITLIGQDDGALAWCYPTPEGPARPMRTPLAAETEWKRIVKGEIPPAAAVTLLEELQRDFPASPAIYPQLARRSGQPEEALEFLLQALDYGVVAPDILALLAQTLMALDQADLALEAQKYLRVRFSNYRMPPSPWKVSSTWNEPLSLDLPARPSLSIVIAAGPGGEVDLKTLACIDALADELLIASLVESDELLALADEHGAGLIADEEALSEALAEASSEWVCVLFSGETLTSDSIAAIEQLLWNNPPGLRVYSFQHQGPALIEPGTQDFRLVPRLFPSHISFQWDWQAHVPRCDLVTITPQPLPGVTLHSKVPTPTPDWDILCSQLQTQPSPEGLLAAGRYWLDQDQPERAGTYFQQACESWEHWVGKGAAPPGLVEARMRWLQCLTLTEAPVLETELRRLETVSEDLPDFWYLRGRYYLAYPEYRVSAIQSLEKCLMLRPEHERLGHFHTTQCFAHAAALLVDLYGLRAWDPTLGISERQNTLKSLRQALGQLLQQHPDGVWSPERPNLYLLLGQSALLSARCYPSSALEFFRAGLPSSGEEALMAYYMTTALRFCEGLLDHLLEHLPPIDLTFESLRDLRSNPLRLIDFTDRLWEMPDMDGRELATCFLYAAATQYQEASYLMHLARLHQEMGDNTMAQQIWQETRRMFPDSSRIHTTPKKEKTA